MDTIDFQGRFVVVTGGAKGLGLAISQNFALRGATVALVGRDTDALSSAVRDLQAIGAEAFGHPADLTDHREVARLASELAAHNRPIDVLVTAAGQRDPNNDQIADRDTAQLEAVILANLRSTILPIQALLPQMLAQGSGRIVLISGAFGLRGRAGRAAPVTAKWGLEGFMRSLALEAGPRGITANAVCPGYVSGARAEAAFTDQANRRSVTVHEVRKELEDQTALKRLVSSADVANAVMFLASDMARNITGLDLKVDSGWAI